KGIQLFKDSISFFVNFPKSVIGYFGFAKQPIGTVAYTGGVAYTTPSASPALIGIGYIIGPTLSAITFCGGVLAWLVLIPLVLFIDPNLAHRLGGTMPGGIAPWDVLSYTVWYNVIRPIAVGAMLVGAVYALFTMRDSILRSIRGAFAASGKGARGEAVWTRLDLDIPIRWIVGAIVALVIPITIIYQHFAHSWHAAILAALVMTGSGFFLAAVAGYLVGLVGSSNNPVSGLTLVALVIAALLMVGIGVKGVGGIAAVLGIASVVCCACCVSGSLMQDLKAGYILGGTPWKMELAEVFSVTALAFFLLWPIIVLNQANLKTGGIGGLALPAPQAGLMAQLAQGIVGGQMPWGLLLMGIMLGVALVMIKAPSPMLIAVGMYLPLETTSAIFLGGILKWVADRVARGKRLNSEQHAKYEERGTLIASGFIAGEAIMGIILASVFITGIPSLTWLITHHVQFSFVPKWGRWLSLIAFAIIAWCLIRIPIKNLRRDNRAG
ncbi:MAG TPA: oligopeptide transporter, OPT family, partial [Terriglobia bacterium]|nr:oligopeptide transporter, OPT family [Terriglobia bacterium]